MQPEPPVELENTDSVYCRAREYALRLTCLCEIALGKLRVLLHSTDEMCVECQRIFLWDAG